MEIDTDTMTTVAPHDRETERLNVIRNYIPQLSVHSAWLTGFYRLHQRIVCAFNKKS
jgi:hypothetical protein